MKFKDYDSQMRLYEESLDQIILPGMYCAARLDGRSFTKLTSGRFKKPFDAEFRELMIETTEALMKTGFNIVYGYTQSDEISLLFHPDDNTFGRKVRKINTTLAGEASATFSLLYGSVGTFDCRIVPLPNKKAVADYFDWRQKDSHRNSINAWCYWTLRKEGNSKRKATSMLENKTVSDKNELLFERGINYNDLPSWQKRGVGVYYQTYEKEGYNPLTKETVKVVRNALYTDFELPIGQPYKEFVTSFLP